MSQLKVNKLQIGQSGTATQNFSLEQPAVPDGTVKLVRGNSGAGSQDILTVDASGRVAMPNNVVAFSARINAATPNAPGNFKVAFQLEDFDTTNAFDSTTNYRFQPQVAGYYQISGSVAFSSGTGVTNSQIWKNGSAWIFGASDTLDAVSNQNPVSGLVYLNGSTDYVELYAYCPITNGMSATGGAYTYFQGILIAKA